MSGEYNDYSGKVKIGNYNYVEGFNNLIETGSDTMETVNHAEGLNNRIKNGANGVHVEGIENTSSGSANSVGGMNNTLTAGAASHIHGMENTLEGDFDSVSGTYNTVSGNYSHISGTENTVSKDGTFAAGQGLLKEKGETNTVFGKYNEDKNLALSVGGGTSKLDRKNLLELDWNGNLKVSGKIDGAGSGSGLTPCGEIRFTASRLYVGNEEYRLQRGSGRRIIAVTQGKKCTQIYAKTEAESEAAAVTAVTHGLETPWDIEFDVYIAGDGWSAFFPGMVGLGECTSAEIDYGDGSEVFTNGLAPHSYEKQGVYHIRIRTDAKELTMLNISGWDYLKETNLERFNEGISVYIGGNIESAVNPGGSCGNIGRLVWGESAKYIAKFTQIGRDIKKENLDVSLPPFFTGLSINGEKLTQSILTYSPLDYLCIPSSCVYIPAYGFEGCALSRLDIEPDGNTLELGMYAFRGNADITSNNTKFLELKILDIPARVSFGYMQMFGTNADYFRCSGVRIIRLQNGFTAIPANCFNSCSYSRGFLIENNAVIPDGYHELYVFIPKTVTSIEYGAFPSNGKLNVIYEGSTSEWNAITKASGWCNESKCKVKCCGSDTIAIHIINLTHI